MDAEQSFPANRRLAFTQGWIVWDTFASREVQSCHPVMRASRLRGAPNFFAFSGKKIGSPAAR